MPRNLLDLSEGEFREFLDSFDVVLFDCDGEDIELNYQSIVAETNLFLF
jgi:hypothetical protein